MNIFNQDFADFINAFENNRVEYVLVGGLAVVLHGYNRTTGDMDILVRPSSENYNKMLRAFHEFGLPESFIKEVDFLNPEDKDVFTFGRPPLAIDVMTKMKGVTFDEVFDESQMMKIEGLNIRVVHLNHLIAAKKASGRYKDLDDIENLEKLKD